MKTIIYYFSGTGNSLAVARDLSYHLEDAEIISIGSVIDSDIRFNADRIGIVFPVYMWGIPLIVRDFVRKFSGLKGKYIFAVATYGTLMGATLVKLQKFLKIRDVELKAGFGIMMPGNYIPLYGAADEEKQKKMFVSSKKKIKEISLIVKEGKKHKIEKSFFLFNVVASFLSSMFSPVILNTDISFWSDDKCDSCGLCEKICPVENITLKDGKPLWHNNCQQCMACIQWCPKKAIQFKNKTLRRKRYNNPKVRVEDFLRVRRLKLNFSEEKQK